MNDYQYKYLTRMKLKDPEQYLVKCLNIENKETQESANKKSGHDGHKRAETTHTEYYSPE